LTIFSPFRIFEQLGLDLKFLKPRTPMAVIMKWSVLTRTKIVVMHISVQVGGRGGRPPPGLKIFRASAQLLKNPECKTYTQFTEIF